MIHNCPDLEEAIEAWGILPLLSIGIPGWSAEELTAEACQYTKLPDGGWEWPLWKWKGGCHTGDWLCLWQVHHEQGCFHQQETVARLLQLATICLTQDRRRQHRRNDSLYT